MKKRLLKTILTMVSVIAITAYFTFPNLVIAVNKQTPTKFVFSDSEITAENGDYTDYEISKTSLVIKGSGTYEVYGSCENGSIKVKKGVDNVNIVLCGINLSAQDTAPLCFNKSSGVTLTAKENTINSFSDGEKNNDDNYPDNENAENAVIKCKDGSNVLINGTGTINITANAKNAIKAGESTEDDGSASLTIEDLNLNITADVNDAVNAQSALYIKSGNLNISAADDAIHSDYDLVIGSLNADNDDLNINITSCYEGLEGANIKINSGNIKINSDDDGINAANSDLKNYNFTLELNGGNLYVNAKNGDGIDSNGSLTVTGGNIEVYSTSSGANSPLDSDGEFTITGGTVLAVGNSSMAQTPKTSSQNYLVFSGGNEMRGMPGGGFGNENVSQFNGKENQNGRPEPPQKPQGDNSKKDNERNFGGNFEDKNRPTGEANQNPNGSGKNDENRPVPPDMPNQNPNGDGNQNENQNTGKIVISAGDKIEITDSANNILCSSEAVRSANYVFYSSGAISDSETYTLKINSEEAMQTTVSESTANKGFGGFGQNGIRPDMRPGGNNGENPPELPDGANPGGAVKPPQNENNQTPPDNKNNTIISSNLVKYFQRVWDMFKVNSK